jgi:hypothetical protein
LDNNKLERLRKDVVMGLLMVLFRHLPGRTEENHENSQSAQLVSWPRFEPGICVIKFRSISASANFLDITTSDYIL